MRREVGLGLVAVGAVLLAAIGFWATAPSVDIEPEEVERIERSDIGAAPAREVQRDEPDEIVSDEPEVDDGPVVQATDGDADVLGGEKGALKRLRRTLSDLERVPDEVELDPEMDQAEQDALLAKPISDKTRILARIKAQATSLQNSEDPAKRVRGLLILAEAHDHMARWLPDRPVPTYLPEQGAGEFIDALEQRGADQATMAEDVRSQAREQATELPEDHPLWERLGS